MAAVNSVQGGLRLPLTGLAPPRVLMCSASMGAEGSVTLQLREAVQAPGTESNHGTLQNVRNVASGLDAALTIGYPDPEILAEMLGTLQAAGADTTFDIIDNSDHQTINNTMLKVNGITSATIPITKSETVAKVIDSQNNSNTISNVVITTAPSSAGTQQPLTTMTTTTAAATTIISQPVANVVTPKKQRPKTASPTRHGPQQCQVCSKVFGNASALAKHKLTHSDERKYVCAMCSKAFKRQDHLNGHLLTHRNKKPYECKAEGCGKSYCDARSLRRHTENHHSSMLLSTTTTTSANVSSTTQNQSTNNTNSANNNNNNNNSTTTGPPSGPSLSPATASGDASSPHGAQCIQYQTNDTNTIATINSKSPSPSSPAGTGNEGLTRQQLDLISQIMQQTKQANGLVNGHKIVQRPRTWNMQTQLQQNQSKSPPNNENSNNQPANGTIVNNDSVKQQQPVQQQHQQQQQQQQQQTIQQTNQQNQNQTPQNQQQNVIKVEQKPVECNLCHRKFKNIPALNGHMRLHGGYFKKDSDTKKCDKKESSGPPLQTASVGVRALIEEKIINKRNSKELKGSFVVPAPPLSARRTNETETTTVLNATKVTPTVSNNTITIVASGITTTANLNALTKQPIVQQIAAQQVTTATTLPQKTTQITPITADTKDATLIELLKRGTKVAVKRACSDPGQLAQAANHATKDVITNSSFSANNTPVSTPPLALSLSSGNSSPLSLTISQAPSTSGSTDVYTLSYSTDSSPTLFSDSDVYNVNDTAMLLQAVDSIQLLQDSSPSDHLDDIAALSDYALSENFTPSRQLQAVLDSPLPDSLAEFSALHSKDFVLYGCSTESPATQSSNSPLPSPLAYPTPPASHEAVAQASPFLDDSHYFSDASTFFHDDKKSISSINDDSIQWFKNTKDVSKMTKNERIMQLKNELFNDSKVLEDTNIFRNNKSILDDNDLFKTDNSFLSNDSKTLMGDNSAKLQDFYFLDEPQAFSIDDGRNTSSPLSASFFSAAMSSAEEVKEALEEVLPNEDDGAGSTLDLHSLPGLSLQSQMMPNSEDPLLSSAPKDFIHHRQMQQSVPTMQQQQQQQQQQQHQQQQHQMQQHEQSTNQHQSLGNSNQMDQHLLMQNSFDPFSPPSSKKIKIENDYNDKIFNSLLETSDNSNKIPLTVQTEQILTKDNFDSVFLSPNSISSSNSSPKLQTALLTNGKKRLLGDGSTRKQELFKSKLKRIPQLHFTPAPILNPERCGTGLYSAIPKTKLLDLISDNDVIDFFEKPRINIGSDYQAIIPEVNINYFEDNKDHQFMQWKPEMVEDKRQLDRYVELAKSSAIPLGTHSEEVALKTLLDSHGEIHVAILKLLQAPDTSLHKRWSQIEMEFFLKGLEQYGKDFYRISKDIPNKTTGDCIQLYYFWKKLCNEYKTTHLPLTSSANYSASNNNFCDYMNNNSSGNQMTMILNQHNNSNHNNELRPHLCEVPDCSASFSSRAALHGHTRIHCIGRNTSALNNGNLITNNHTGTNIKDDFPCKVCGKVFNKVKSRSAHMKSHRPQDNEPPSST